MIRVNRPPATQTILDALLKKNKQGKTEREEADAYYGANPPPTSSWDGFERYKADPVCEALDAIFHGKCAYCESSYRALEARNVEHYRPKGGIAEAPAHPGYWWLAATWENLLPSCPICNQIRRHVVYDGHMTLAEFEAAKLEKAEKVRSGKLDAFPVAAKNWQTIVDGPLNAEDPLLLNPCECDPENHIEWNFDWTPSTPLWEAEKVTALVRPRTANGTEDIHAVTSIGVYGLNRAGLVEDRMLRIKDLQRVSLPIVKTFLKAGQQQTPEPEIEADLQEYTNNLMEFAESEQRYAGMALAFAKRFLLELEQLR